MKIIDIFVIWLLFPIVGIFEFLNFLFPSYKQEDEDDILLHKNKDEEDTSLVPTSRPWRRKLTYTERLQCSWTQEYKERKASTTS